MKGGIVEGVGQAVMAGHEKDRIGGAAVGPPGVKTASKRLQL
ncbi:MAG TPA: hypothetical protein VFE31_03700 [Opitutaceae bacterium]|nr:hypothetical protein [Opitutaceae bacterium]